MRIESTSVLDGPNVYHHKPVMLMRLRLDDLTNRETRDVAGFVPRLLERLPGLATHHCSRGHAGGFVERLNEGTYFGHVVEHVALELAGMLGSRVTYGKTRYAGEPGLYDVIVRFRSEAGMRVLLRTAVELVDALVRDEPYPLDDALDAARERIRDTELGPSTRAIVEAADERGIPWRRLNDLNLVELGYGKHRKRIQAALTSGTSHIAVDVVADKALTKSILASAHVPVPEGVVVENVEQAIAALEALGGRVVVKPLDGNQGNGVSLGVATQEQIAVAFARAVEHSDRVLIEEHVEGRDYRVLVVGGVAVAASEREPCHVVGDGQRTIGGLIDAANRDPARGVGHGKPLTEIVVDDIVVETLARSGRRLEDVPAAGERVVLRQNANLSHGGTARDVTDRVHPATRRLCERAARAVDLDVCGVDLVTPDIAEPLRGRVIELNAAPGLRMHLHPSHGAARNVGRAVLDLLYPDGAPSRIPVVSVTGTNGKTTVTRLIAHVLGFGGAVVGTTTSDGIFVGSERIAEGDTTGPASARTVLSDPTVEYAVLETARGGIVRRGLGYDWSDVAVVTNIQEDHIGQDGIEDIEDLVWIKSLVAERVRRGGTLVVNAEDPHASALPDRPRIADAGIELVCVSIDPAHARFRRHLAAGRTGYTIDGGWLVEVGGGRRERMVRIASIPITFRGTALHQVSNCLLAVAACRALGHPAAGVAPALTAFTSDSHNPGRAHLFAYGNGYVLVDYGHNPAAFLATSDTASRWGCPVIGVVGVPGDRDDATLEKAARVAARGFDRIVIREDRDLRGRQPGEAAELLRRAVRSERPGIQCDVVLDERQALESVLDDVAAGAAAVYFYDALDPILALLRAVGAIPVTSAGPEPADAPSPARAAEPGRRTSA